MTQPTLLELAKQGNPKAIATLISRSLKAQGITAKVGVKGDCLRVMLEAKQVPNEQALVQVLRQGLTKLEPVSIKTVQVSGKQVGTSSPAWIRDFKLVVNSQPLTQTSLQNQVAKKNLSGNHRASLTAQTTVINRDYKEPIKDSLQPGGKSSLIKILKSSTYFSSLFSLKKIYRSLVVLLWSRLIFDILFAFYALTWASSFLFIRLLDTVDTTGVLAYILYSLYRVLDWLWLPIELARNWIYLVALIVTLVWLHRLHAKLKVLFSGYPISPWGAIARFLIPFYSLWGIWNLFTTLTKTLKSQNGELVSFGSSLQKLLPWLYVALIVSNVLDQAYRVLFQEGYNSEIYPWLFVMSNAMNLVFSIVFLQMVRLIRKAIVYKSLQVSGQSS